MQLGDTLRLAFASLSARKLRTLLTLLGLIIGVTSLILVMTLIQGANGYVEARIANLGTDIFQGSKVPLATTDFQEILKARKHRDLTFDDCRALEYRCQSILAGGAPAPSFQQAPAEPRGRGALTPRARTSNRTC